MNQISRKLMFLPLAVILLLMVCFTPKQVMAAGDTKAVSIGVTDYEELTMEVQANGNTLLYYSLDNKVWYEVEGYYDSVSDSYRMDISWISNTKDVTVYFKGNTVKTVVEITVPGMNQVFKVVYDKIEGEFLLDNTEDSDVFQWRKASGYHWYTVSLREDSQSYLEFLDKMEQLRAKGVKVVFRIPQQKGTNGLNLGERPSKEITVTLTKRGNAPKVKVDVSKFYFNTTASMEYYDSVRKLWMDCDKNMEFADFIPQVLYKNGAKSAEFMIRTAATSKAPYSMTAFIQIEGQGKPPVIGDNSAEVSYYYMNSKLILSFPKATKTNIYEYAVVRADETFDLSTAKWKSANSSKQISLSTSSAPQGSKIYVRQKGSSTNEGDRTKVIPSSEVNQIQVNYPKQGK